MSTADHRNPPTHRTASTARALLLLAALGGCATEQSQQGDAPFLLPGGSDADEAPFRGPAEKLSPPPIAQEPPLEEVAGPAEIAVSGPGPQTLPYAPTATTEADRRREIWLRNNFRCKAISSTRLRRCRFEQTDAGFRLRFPMSDVVCQDVAFDEHGDPERLTGCKGAWLVVPKSNRLRPNRAGKVWSGSHSGWRWKGDRQRYCCPGMWLEAPATLQI
jgi:hypothetical protein